MKTNALSAATTLAVLLAVPAWADCGGGGCPGAGGGMGMGLWLVKPLLLATLALGYWVLRTARADQGWLKRVGQAVGWIVMLASVAVFACTFCCAKKGSCPMGGSGLAQCAHHEPGEHEAHHGQPVKPAKKR